MRFSILNVLFFAAAVCAVVLWQVDKMKFNDALSNYGEETKESLEDQTDYGIHSIFVGGDLCLVVPRSEVEEVCAESTLDFDDPIQDVVHPSEIQKNGQPGPKGRRALDKLFGKDGWGLSIESLNLESFDDTFLWKVNWEVYPSSGGMSGIVPTFTTVLTAGGKRIEPIVFLRSYYGSYFSSDEKQVFSVFPADWLMAASDIKVDEEELIERATSKLDEACKEFGIKVKFRFHKIEKKLLSGSLQSENENLGKDLEIWKVTFVDKAIASKTKIANQATEFSIWIDRNFRTSVLSNNQWDLTWEEEPSDE